MRMIKVCAGRLYQPIAGHNNYSGDIVTITPAKNRSAKIYMSNGVIITSQVDFNRTIRQIHEQCPSVWFGHFLEEIW